MNLRFLNLLHLKAPQSARLATLKDRIFFFFSLTLKSNGSLKNLETFWKHFLFCIFLKYNF